MLFPTINDYKDNNNKNHPQMTIFLMILAVFVNFICASKETLAPHAVASPSHVALRLLNSAK